MEIDTDEVEDLMQELGKPDKKKSTGLLIDLYKAHDALDQTSGSNDDDSESAFDDPDDSDSKNNLDDSEGLDDIVLDVDYKINDLEDNGDNMANKSDNVVNETKEVKVDVEQDGYDPDAHFRMILADAGLKRGVKAISESFFNGEIDNPHWLNYVLMEAGIGKKHRNLILMSYYGAPPSELGITDDISNSPHYKHSISGQKNQQSNKQDDDFDAELKKTEMANLESVKRELAMKKLKKESLRLDEELSNIGKKNEPPVETAKTRTVQRPLFNERGEVRRDNEGRIIAERVIEPVSDSSSSGDMFTMMSTMMQIMDRRNSDEHKQASDPEIAELKHMVTDLAVQQKEAAYKNELDRMRSEKENADRIHQDNIKRFEEDTRDRMEREHNEHIRQLDELKRTFEDKLEQREQMGQLAGAYEKKVDDMKEMMREHQSTVKDTVVKQASSTADKMTSQVGGLVEGAFGPLTEMMQQQYQTNLELFRQQHGLGGNVVPSTSNEELAAYIGEDGE